MSAIRYLPAVLVLLAIAGLASENFSHYPIGVMFLLGSYLVWRDPRAVLSSIDAQLLLKVFACIWIPMLLALPDAVNPARAMKTTALYFHFLPAGLYIVYMLRDLVVRRIVLAGTAAIVAFWCFDGIIQLIHGRDLFGYPYDGVVLKGMFYPKQRFGLVVAVFAPLILHVVQRLSARSPWAWILLLPFIVVVIYSLKRTAWIMLVVGLVGYFVCFFRPTRTNIRFGVIGVGLGAILLCLSIVFAPNLNTRVSDTLKIFSADFVTVDAATSHRLTLWQTGVSIAKSNWLNGVGPRGYRTVYRDYSGADDFWIARGTNGQTHPHLMVLEVLIETGILGIIGYLACLILLLKRLWQQRALNPAASLSLMVAMVAWFPLNAHLAFYGSYWSNIAWLMIALGCISYHATERQA